MLSTISIKRSFRAGLSVRTCANMSAASVSLRFILSASVKSTWHAAQPLTFTLAGLATTASTSCDINFSASPCLPIIISSNMSEGWRLLVKTLTPVPYKYKKCMCAYMCILAILPAAPVRLPCRQVRLMCYCCCCLRRCCYWSRLNPGLLRP